jgi:hypothetical protein
MWVLAVCSFVVLLFATLLTARPDYAIGNFSLLLASHFFLAIWCLGVWLVADAARNLREKRWLISSAVQFVGGVALFALVVWVMNKWR